MEDGIMKSSYSGYGGGKSACIAYGEKMYTRGVWYHQNPLQYVYPLFMFQFLLAFFTTRLLYFLLRPFKQPTFVCYVLGGIILGPSVLGRNKTFQEMIYPENAKLMSTTLSTMSVGFFVFIVTVKMDTDTILRAKNAWRIGITCVIFPLIATLFVCVVLNFFVPQLTRGVNFILYLTSFLSLNFFAAMAITASELNLLTSELGQVAMSAGILNELIAWSYLGVIVVINRESGKELFTAGGCIIIVVVFCFLVLKPGIRWLIRRTPEGKPMHEIYVIGILLLTIIMGILTDLLGGVFILGPIIMGLIVPAGPPLGSALVEKAETMITGFFLPFFFVRVGQLTDMKLITNWHTFLGLECIILTVYFGKMAAALLSALWFRMSLRDGLILGLFFNLRGVVDLILAIRWRKGKYIDEQGFAVMVITHVILTAIGTPLISVLYKPKSRRFQDSCAVANSMRALQTTPFNSKLRIVCCVHYEDNAYSIITFLKAANPNQNSPICAYLVHMVELVGRAAPMLISYNRPRRKFISSPTDRIMRAVNNYLKSSGVPVTVEPYTMIAPYSMMHESICELAHGKSVPLILLPFHKGHVVDTNAAGIRNFNNNVLSFAPCTVGIYVDRSLSHHISSPHFSYNVVCFFLGGEDDREVLALASRMSEHPGVSITLVKIDYLETKDERECERDHYEETERILDKNSVDVFMARNVGNSSVVLRKVSANDGMEVVSAIQDIEASCDLVIVGNRRGPTNRNLEKEMMPWIEYEELGVIGDMIASPDFYGGMMSVLVIRHCLDYESNVSSSKSENIEPRDKNMDLECGPSHQSTLLLN